MRVNPKIVIGVAIIIGIITTIVVLWVKSCNNRDKYISLSKKLENYHNMLENEFPEKYDGPISINFPVYYINLDRSPERRIHMEKQAKKFNIRLNRISGVDDAKLKSLIEGTYEDFKYAVYGYEKYSKGELGCTLSHLKAIRTAYDKGDAIAIIMEDDVSFNLIPHWNKNLEQIMDDAPKNWNIISLLNSCNTKASGTYVDDIYCWGTQVYIINREGMKNILNGMNKGEYILDKEDIHNSNMLPADRFIYKRSGHQYTYTYKSMFYIYNASDIMNSTIHTSHTRLHIEAAIKMIESHPDLLR